MLPKLQISSFVLKRLERLKNQNWGCLYGGMFNSTVIVFGFNVESPEGTTLNYKQIQNNFPAEIDLCGLVQVGDSPDTEASLNRIIAEVDVTDNPILFTCDAGGANLKAFFKQNGKLTPAEFEVLSEEELYQSFAYVRLRFDINEFIDDPAHVPSIFMARRKQLASGHLCFNIEGTDVYLNASSSGVSVTGMNTDSDIQQILALISKQSGSGGKGPNAKRATSFEVVNVQSLIKRSPAVKSGHHYLQLSHTRDGNGCDVPIQVDALSLLHRNTGAVALYDILVESVCRNLRLLESCLVREIADRKAASRPQVFHFLLPDFGHFFSCAYPKAILDDTTYLREQRRTLHDHFGIPKTRPLFQRTDQYSWTPVEESAVLLDVHVGLKAAAVSGGRQYLVQGSYGYHHYMQDAFDDNGWGCAYRSLQTLCSWFRHQRYSSRPIPTHRQIQEILVKLGDKPKSFIDSRQWIGSTEVAMVLQSYMGIDSRILNVRTGAQMADLGPDLSMHFQSQGTPIMIGGGVLAHTILGIDYNAETNELKFLILDPHYTGADDLAVIQSKGWCTWKTTNFWDKKSYYNLCMPIRPAYV